MHSFVCRLYKSADCSSVICTFARILITLKPCGITYIHHTYWGHCEGKLSASNGVVAECGGVFILHVPHLQEPRCGFSKQVVALLKEEGCVHTNTQIHTPERTHARTHARTHTHTYAIHPSIHSMLSSENTTRVRRCRSFRLVLRCWWSGLTEALVVVKSLLMECLVAVLTLDHLYGEVTLSLMVGQTCLIPSLERAARMAAV